MKRKINKKKNIWKFHRLQWAQLFWFFRISDKAPMLLEFRLFFFFVCLFFQQSRIFSRLIFEKVNLKHSLNTTSLIVAVSFQIKKLNKLINKYISFFRNRFNIFVLLMENIGSIIFCNVGKIKKLRWNKRFCFYIFICNNHLYNRNDIDGHDID